MSQSLSPALRVYNTLTRQIEPFETIDPGKVRMYVCGVTVYDHAHIGHVMSSIVFDVIRRYLMYLGYDVTFAQNFTDVDDKIINRANAEGIDPASLTEALIANWGAEMSPFNVLPATVNPRATQAIPQIIEMIEGLIEDGHAYEADGDVYYKVRSFSEYGKLSHRNIDELLVGARISPGEQKSDPLDFVLWKAAKPGEPTWPSPWSDGRPGWHIECSAMNKEIFGDQIDIHGGGRDLIFPHHENEIAQSEAFTGHPPFARYWMHNGMLQLADEKMSKSIGNVMRPTEIIDRGRAMAFRLQVHSSHYRAPLTFTEEGLEAAQNGLDRLRVAARPIDGDINTQRDNELDLLVDTTVENFHAAMMDDFDTAVAVASIFDLGRAINRGRSGSHISESVVDARTMLIDLAGILGLDLAEPTQDDMIAAEPFIDLLVQIRNDLRAARQFELADKVRDELTNLGVTLEDTRQGTTWKTT
ncbi:MAG TPA: cysteine--tRNA ligase [Thermomicrobiales bacterium]|nr:cysteine--tRNA ligase [Thermomicrobiales bacterium]